MFTTCTVTSTGLSSMGRCTSLCVAIPHSHIKLLTIRAVDSFEQPGHDICEDTLLFLFSSVLHNPSDVQVYYIRESIRL